MSDNNKEDDPKVDVFVETDLNLSICRRCGKKMRTKRHDDGCIEIFIDEHIDQYHKDEYTQFRKEHFLEQE